MRLLDTNTFEIQEFYTDIPPYAILSHTWEKDEVTFQDMQNLWFATRKQRDQRTPQDTFIIHAVTRKAGYKKVWKACEHARKYDFRWIWIDSCCINKESSAELSEAINSMYQHYEDSEVCYVYLCDVSSTPGPHPRDPVSTFRNSRWFKRGWTLQELIAPSFVVFLDVEWNKIGTRWELQDVVSAITSIPVRAFTHGDVEEYSVAQKMSWAAFRQTTRPEDLAYCLMGIFGVSMPPIYGEGAAKAFLRLQQEIIKISDDRSIFAWIASEGESAPRGLLARCPFEFRASGEVRKSETGHIGDESSYSFGNNGLRIALPLESPASEDSTFLASLLCRSDRKPDVNQYFSVYLQKVAGQGYVRCRPEDLELVPLSSSASVQRLVVREAPISRKRKDKHYDEIHATVPAFFNCTMNNAGQVSSQTSTLRVWPRESVKFTFRNPPWPPIPFAFLNYHSQRFGESFFIALDRLTRCLVVTETRLDTMDDVSRLFAHDEGDGVRRFTKKGAHLLHWSSSPACFDTVVAPLKSGALVSCTFQMTGNTTERILEVVYIPSNPCNIFMTRLLDTPNCGFMVPFKVGDWTLQQIYPPDFFSKECGGQTYISMPNTGDLASTFRVIIYKAKEPLPPVYVTVGFANRFEWIDAGFFELSKETGEEIWRSYLGSGSRRLKKSRHGGSWPCMTMYDLDDWRFRDTQVIASIRYPNTILQLGSFILHIDFGGSL
ncbi:hypothetical protein D9758_006635 [Tetrapyrgos nigripes]|uniref:Heterokaryon incompatibility domain-containing protein n=1 Tax=Tetrapyrgos nigripes TaxID=182062 RepID=A0A8H5LQQ4_9AGAR|nr:hypothetical protein D9758_006635 [Tetrapyrgos nigripes]